MNRLQLLVWQLGPPADYILKDADKQFLVEWALLAGYPPEDVETFNAVLLANLYVNQSQPSDIQRATSAAITATIKALPSAPVDEELIRYLARIEAQKLIDEMTPQRLEIVSPRGSITLDGPLHYRTALVIQETALGHAIMLVGPAGCGKTTIGQHVSRALQLPFYITNVINETHELTGFVSGYGVYHSTPFRQAYEHGGLWLADEIDAWDASALLAANSALANGYINFPDHPEPVYRHSDFRMIATANTFGTGADRVYVGRNELDAASLDRFAMITVDYDLQLERMFANGADAWLEHVWDTRRKVQEKRIRHVVSSRAISTGAAALAAGIAWDDVNEIHLMKGMSAKDREKIS